MIQRIRKQIFKHYTGLKIATFFDVESGAEVFGPRQFLEYLAASEGSPQNSLDAAHNDLFLFLKYLSACADLQIEHGSWLIDTGAYLNRILLMYPSFLAEGKRSPNQFVASVAQQLEFEALAPESVRRYLSTLNQFLKFNDSEWISHQAMCQYFQLDTFLTEESLMGALAQQTLMSGTEKKALLTQSMLAGVISGGPKKIRRPKIRMPKRFKQMSDPEKKLFSKSFPINKVLELIRQATSFRDVCLFSLLAGTGIRTHEAMQLRMSDILVEEETIKILPYGQRIQVYSDVDEDDLPKLSFKGRTTQDVEFIKVFKDIFFDNLFSYLEERDRAMPDHEFFFVVLSDNGKGRAWFLGDATSHNRTFKSTQRRMRFDQIYSLHSLRHFYGTWMRNYEPNRGGFGLPLDTVKRAMGHKNSGTTESYSIPDKAVELERTANFEKALIEYGYDRTQVMELVESGSV
ncbi:tyrosine-type recombinase/integrase [Marinobacter salarius]